MADSEASELKDSDAVSQASSQRSTPQYDLAADDEEQPVEASEHPSSFEDAGSQQQADSTKATASADKSIPENALRYARSKQYINFLLDDLRFCRNFGKSQKIAWIF